jgi:hypothetical protein
MLNMSPATLKPIDQHFPWTRYWQVQDSARGTDSEEDHGEGSFLYAHQLSLLPEADLEVSAPYRTLSQLLEKPAAILLGRPGSGKSTELELALRDQATIAGRIVIYFDAKECSNDPATLFQHPRWQSALGQPVLLVLDGADELLMECPRYVNQLAARLRQERAARPAGSLHIVISCRHAEWPEDVAIWPREECVIARLCQLTATAAEDFVKEHLGEQASAFWTQVNQQKVEFLAVWPHSLGELVQEFHLNGGHLPSSLFELIQKAAQRRCDPHHSDTDSGRPERHPDRPADIPWMFRIAGRLAALSCFSGRHQISPRAGDTRCISATDLLIEPEPWLDHSSKLITASDLSTLFKTALFMPLSQGRFCFAHQMFREFMAAAWLAQRGVTVPQLETLVGSRTLDGMWRHYPQLAPIAAWLASNPAQTDWQNFLIENDPAVLLRADAAILPAGQKRRIVEALLSRAVTDQAVDVGWRHRHLRSLACPSLVDILRPYLLNFAGSHEAARDLAIDIVTEANVKEAAPILWEAIRKPYIKLRSDIAHALFSIAKDTCDTEWQAVLDGEIPLDEQGALLGAALMAMVPRVLKVRDILRHLIPPRDFNIYGYYTQACALMLERVEMADVRPIVHFSIHHQAAGYAVRDYDTDKETLVTKALKWLSEELDDPSAMSLLVEWWVTALRYNRYIPHWGENRITPAKLGFGDITRRRLFVEEALRFSQRPHQAEGDVFWNFLSEFICLPEDLSWLVERLLKGTDREQRILAHHASGEYFSPELTPERRRLLQDLYDRCGYVRALLPHPQVESDIFGQIEADRMKRKAKDAAQAETYAKKREQQREDRGMRMEQFRVNAHHLFNEGDWGAWNWVEKALFFEQNPSGGGLKLKDINLIHEKNEPWMFEAARRWLRHEAPLFPSGDDKKELNCGISSIWALFALWREVQSEPQFRESICKGWLPFAYNQMVRSCWTHEDFQLESCVTVFGKAGVSALFEIIRHDYLRNGELYFLKSLPNPGHDAPKLMKELLLANPIQAHGISQALGWLVVADFQQAVEVANHWLRSIPPDRLEQQDAALYAAMCCHLRGSLWDELRKRLWGRPDSASKVLSLAFGTVGFDFDQELEVAKWPQEFTADITELIFLTYPPSSDKKGSEDGTVTRHDGVQHVRDRLVSVLGDLGMTSAIQRLLKLGLRGSERWLWQVHLRALSTKQAAEWPAVSPGGILALAKDHELSLVRDSDALLTAVMKALDRYQTDLRTTDHGRKLRNDDGSSRLENALSDSLAQWLKDKLHIIGHREVKTIHDKREDLNITLTQPGREPLELTIEVKKDDSDLLMEKMETQLKNLYLEGQNRTHGIYLVFWFQDGRFTLEQIQTHLDQQAAKLSQHPYQIKARVLDCRLKTLTPPDPHRPTKAGAKHPASSAKKRGTKSQPTIS